MTLDESVERLAALVRMDNDESAPLAHCEECGERIPVEHALCNACAREEA